ncbi:uncharacterized protein LOC128151939 [Harpia harpyja]|uniref:uncharacterized protein LOC128151939 n=1 Tax=Harpia harpyja TaxID=202280 RepID=UPI0022B1BE4A|nr:uncharacterized protein LOC128151939 [Harpia harpyja]
MLSLPPWGGDPSLAREPALWPGRRCRGQCPPGANPSAPDRVRCGSTVWRCAPRARARPSSTSASASSPRCPTWSLPRGPGGGCSVDRAMLGRAVGLVRTDWAILDHTGDGCGAGPYGLGHAGLLSPGWLCPQAGFPHTVCHLRRLLCPEREARLRLLGGCERHRGLSWGTGDSVTRNVQRGAWGNSLLLRVKEERGLRFTPRGAGGRSGAEGSLGREPAWRGVPSPCPVGPAGPAPQRGQHSRSGGGRGGGRAPCPAGDSSTGGCGATPSPAAPAEQRLCQEEMQALEICRLGS